MYIIDTLKWAPVGRSDKLRKIGNFTRFRNLIIIYSYRLLNWQQENNFVERSVQS